MRAAPRRARALASTGGATGADPPADPPPPATSPPVRWRKSAGPGPPCPWRELAWPRRRGQRTKAGPAPGLQKLRPAHGLQPTRHRRNARRHRHDCPAPRRLQRPHRHPPRQTTTPAWLHLYAAPPAERTLGVRANRRTPDWPARRPAEEPGRLHVRVLPSPQEPRPCHPGRRRHPARQALGRPGRARSRPAP